MITSRDLCIGVSVVLTFMTLAGSPSIATGELVPKNIIILISDGCGYYHVDAGCIYQYGAEGTQIYESWPYAAAMSTCPGDGDGYGPQSTWESFDYVKEHYTDSAAAATAMSAGVKTYNGAIGVDMVLSPLTHLSEIAEELGKSTGVVSSVQLSHATPAGFVAHNASRSNYREIAIEMLLDSRTDVILGCGHPCYDADGNLLGTPNDFKYVGGESVWNGLVDGLTSIDTDGDDIPDNSVEDADGNGTLDPWSLIQAGQHSRLWRRDQHPLGFSEFRSATRHGSITEVATQTLIHLRCRLPGRSQPSRR